MMASRYPNDDANRSVIKNVHDFSSDDDSKPAHEVSSSSLGGDNNETAFPAMYLGNIAAACDAANKASKIRPHRSQAEIAQARKAANRKSAKMSRDRKKNEINDLQKKVSLLTQLNSALKAHNELLSQQLVNALNTIATMQDAGAASAVTSHIGSHSANNATINDPISIGTASVSAQRDGIDIQNLMMSQAQQQQQQNPNITAASPALGGASAPAPAPLLVYQERRQQEPDQQSNNYINMPLPIAPNALPREEQGRRVSIGEQCAKQSGPTNQGPSALSAMLEQSFAQDAAPQLSEPQAAFNDDAEPVPFSSLSTGFQQQEDMHQVSFSSLPSSSSQASMQSPNLSALSQQASQMHLSIGHPNPGHTQAPVSVSLTDVNHTHDQQVQTQSISGGHAQQPPLVGGFSQPDPVTEGGLTNQEAATQVLLQGLSREAAAQVAACNNKLNEHMTSAQAIWHSVMSSSNTENSGSDSSDNSAPKRPRMA